MTLPNLSADQPWRRQGACLGLDVNMFVPDGRGAESPLLYVEARQVCERCPVRTPCLEYAMAAPETLGMWGGTTPRERDVIRRRRQRAASS